MYFNFLNSASDDASDEDPDGGFIVVHGDGNGDSVTGKQSWNCSRTDGPLGPPCVLPRPDDFVQCYDSCPDCDAANSCDFTACLDDLAFVRALVDHVRDNYCLDEDSVHLTGISNGGMFSYYAASRLGDIIARYEVQEVFYPPNHAHTLSSASPPTLRVPSSDSETSRSTVQSLSSTFMGFWTGRLYREILRVKLLTTHTASYLTTWTPCSLVARAPTIHSSPTSTSTTNRSPTRSPRGRTYDA